MEENKEIETLEENKVVEEKKKGNKGLIVVIVLLLLICCGLGGFIFVNKDKIFAKDEEKAEKEEVKEKVNLELTDSIKEKLERFVLIGSNYDVGNTNTTLNHFIEGVTEIPKDVKLKMARNAVYKYGNVKQNEVLSGVDATNISGVQPDNGEIIDIVTKDEFNKRYKELFGEDAIYELEDLKYAGCPAPLAINTSTGEMYLFHRCGGSGATSYDIKITSYDSDTEYYYVHEELVKTDLTTNQTENTKLLWTFDKDLKFIKTEKE